ALSGGPIADVLGRRIGIMVSCIIFSLGVALQTGSSNLPTCIVGRFFAGVGTLRWLVKENRQAAAAESLSRLTSLPMDHPSVQAELQDIRVALQIEREMGESTYKDCFRLNQNKTGLRTLSGIVILALQQLTGINFLFYYGTTFFAHVGIRNPFLVSVANTIVNMGMTLPGMWATDRLGRRPLLLWGGAAMSVCAYLIAILGVTTSVTDIEPQRAIIALMCICITAFASTWGPVGWVVVGEIFPLNVRARAISLAIASHWCVLALA
ncbi:High-affinity glucose transporter RGT2, partial [Trametes pubescens]